MRDAKKLELDEQELMMDAEKDGIKMTASKQEADNRLDLELFKTMQPNKTGSK